MAQSYELDETQYAEYVALRNQAGPVYKMVETIMNNPTARKQLLQARKTVDPTAVIPELDAAQPIQDAMSAIDKKLSELDKKLADDKEERETAKRLAALNDQWESGRAKLRSQGWEEDGITKIEEIMKEKGIPDHAVAAAYFEKINPSPEPITPTSARFDLFKPPSKEDSMNLLLQGDDDRFLNDTINKTLTDIRSGNNRR